jgi:hypothetical protein
VSDAVPDALSDAVPDAVSDAMSDALSELVPDAESVSGSKPDHLPAPGHRSPDPAAGCSAAGLRPGWRLKQFVDQLLQHVVLG